MKKTILFSFITFFFLWNCRGDNSSKSNPIEGTWRLTEVRMDPGDGSGTFQSVTSDKKITFNSNGTFSSNGGFCDMGITATQNSTGLYTYNSTQKTMVADNCGLLNIAPSLWTIELENSNTLIISFSPCTESCQQKYVKQ